MIDAEEAEVLTRAAAEKTEARAQEAFAAAALERARREAAEQGRILTVTKVAPAVEAVARSSGRPDPRDEARARKALVKADRQAAKQAARQIAALEKKEARERKALAKAAARRKTA